MGNIFNIDCYKNTKESGEKNLKSEENIIIEDKNNNTEKLENNIIEQVKKIEQNNAQTEGKNNMKSENAELFKSKNNNNLFQSNQSESQQFVMDS